jgi:hypothetical protein
MSNGTVGPYDREYQKRHVRLDYHIDMVTALFGMKKHYRGGMREACERLQRYHTRQMRLLVKGMRS